MSRTWEVLAVSTVTLVSAQLPLPDYRWRHIAELSRFANRSDLYLADHHPNGSGPTTRSCGISFPRSYPTRQEIVTPSGIIPAD
jgi:hypothetical protein